MSCRMCVDVCPFDAIKMDNKFELSSQERLGRLVFGKEKLLKSAKYFQGINPDEARESDMRIAEKAAKQTRVQAPSAQDTGMQQIKPKQPFSNPDA
jgi:NADH-quinone oxidoreductase subunit I